MDLAGAALKVSASDKTELRVTVTAPDFRPVKVSGRVIATDAAMRVPIRVLLTTSGLGTATPLQTSALPDGSFEFPEVFPGRYSIRLIGPSTSIAVPEVTIVVSTTDLRDVEVVIPRQ